MRADPTRGELEALGIEILPGTDVPALTSRFRVWQAITHGFEIDNPMTSTDLASVVDHLRPAPGMCAVDIPGGRGELLFRLSVHGVAGTGVDISPWVVRDAAERAAARGVALRVVLGDGKAFPREERWDLATSLGGSWIWNGTQGTLHALAGLLRDGGRGAIGDLVLRDGVDPVHLEGVGTPLTMDALLAQADASGMVPVAIVESSEEAWRSYAERCVGFAASWTEDAMFTAEAVAFARSGVEECEAEVASFRWVVVVFERQGRTR